MKVARKISPKPELDVQPPPGCTSCFVRMGQPIQDDACPALAHVHDEQGRWIQSMTLERLAQLRERFQATKASRPDVFERLKAGSFEDELAWLVRHWQDQTRKLNGDALHRIWGAAPPKLVEALAAATGATTELFASPLDVHPHMLAYCSAEEWHQMFGATLDAYSFRWEGVCYAHPPETPDAMERAVRWALASAKESGRRPVATVLLLPDSPSTMPHERWLAYPEAVDMATFGQHQLILLRAEHWQGESRGYVSKGCMGYRLIAIGNEAGCRCLAGRQAGTM